MQEEVVTVEDTEEAVQQRRPLHRLPPMEEVTEVTEAVVQQHRALQTPMLTETEVVTVALARTQLEALLREEVEVDTEEDTAIVMLMQ